MTVVAGGERVRVVGTTLGQQHRPHLLEAWGQRFNLQMDEGHLALFRYSDVPGMIGRVGTVFGEHGINISAAAVGREPPGDEAGARPGGDGGHDRRAGAAEVVDAIVATDGFIEGRSVALGAVRWGPRPTDHSVWSDVPLGTPSALTTGSSAPSARAVPRRLT